MSLYFICDIQMVASEIIIKNTKAWIRPALHYQVKMEKIELMWNTK